MPTMPASLAARAERWFGREVAVTTVEDLSPYVRRVTFTGPSMIGRSWQPGHEVEFRVSARDLRHYTASRFDAASGDFDVVFSTVAGGPGSVWASALRPGSQVTAIGPNPGLRIRPGQRALVLGDATTLGLFAGIGAEQVRGAIEVSLTDRVAARLLTPWLDILVAGDEPGDALCTWTATIGLDEMQCAYLVGNAQSLRRLRTLLRARGVPRDRIVTKAYWATGRAGR